MGKDTVILIVVSFLFVIGLCGLNIYKDMKQVAVIMASIDVEEAVEVYDEKITFEIDLSKMNPAEYMDFFNVAKEEMEYLKKTEDVRYTKLQYSKGKDDLINRLGKYIVQDKVELDKRCALCKTKIDNLQAKNKLDKLIEFK